MDLEKGKRIFFRFNGSCFHIDRDCPDEYKKCGVPKDIEQQWLEEIKINFLTNINVEKGCSKVILINNYIQLLDNESAVDFLIEILNQMELDTFSMIIVLETLKQYLSYSISEKQKERINSSLILFKNVMLSQKIEVDDKYKGLSYMNNYDFSDENVIKRINRI